MDIISRTSVLNISEFLDDVSIVKLHDTNKYNSITRKIMPFVFFIFIQLLQEVFLMF